MAAGSTPVRRQGPLPGSRSRHLREPVANDCSSQDLSFFFWLSSYYQPNNIEAQHRPNLAQEAKAEAIAPTNGLVLFELSCQDLLRGQADAARMRRDVKAGADVLCAQTVKANLFTEVREAREDLEATHPAPSKGLFFFLAGGWLI